MVDDKLVDYIKKEMRKGFSINEIKDALITSGYDKDVVNASINQIHVKDKSYSRESHFLYILLSIIILGIVLSFFYIIFFDTEPVEFSEERPSAEDFKEFNIAINSGDSSKCENVGLLKDDCYSRIALLLGDELLCKKTVVYEKTCIALVRQDENLCENIGEREELCYLELAKLKKDENICEKTDKGKGACFYALARIKNNVNICEKAETQKNACLDYFNK